MLKLRSFASLLFLVVLTLACETGQEVKKGKLEFAFDLPSTNTRAKAESEALRFVVITVEDNAGNTVYDRKKIELYKFGEQYLSEPVEFISGQYALTEFFVLNNEGEIVYATPLEGSALAHLVTDPLPIFFTITEDETIKVTPEVIAIDEFSAEDFGYSTFSFDVVETVSFQLAVFTYDETTENFELTASNVSVTASGSQLFDQALPGLTNRVVVHDGYELYDVTVSKAGYQSYHHTFTKDSLLQYHSGAVLKVILLKGDSSSMLDGLVGYYPFNGNANDESPEYDNHGVVNGPLLTTDRKGNPGSAYSFNGVNNYISIADNDATDFEAAQDFTISVWVSVKNPQADPSGSIFDIIRKWNGNNSNGYPYSISFINEHASPPNRFLIVRYDGQICQNIPTMYSTPVTDYEGWHHLVMIKEGSRMKFYLNNELVADIEDTSSCNTSNNIHMTIGSRGQLVRFFTGKIDDVRFYNRAVSASEVDILFHE
jgi:Concanavalin A-like lectin/glucanases superfamily